MHYDFLDDSLQELFQQFLMTFSSQKTRSFYIMAVRRICEDKGSFLSLTPDDVTDHFSHLDLAESTKSVEFYSLRSFSVYLANHINDYESPFVFLQLGKKAPDYSLDDFPEEELPELFTLLGNDSDTALAVRLAIHMCLSVSEISNLRSDMFTFRKSGECILSLQRVMATDQSDGYSHLQVPEILIAPIRQRMDREYLILTTYGKKTSIRSLQHHLLVTKTSWTFQKLRTYGMFLKLQQGYSEFEVAEYAGVDGRWLYRYRKMVNNRDLTND